VIQIRYGLNGTFNEPVYDWGYGPLQPLVIPASPPFRQPEWPSGEGHGRIPVWKVNGIPVDLEARWPVYDGPDLTVGTGILELRNPEGDTYRVDYTGSLPVFYENGKLIDRP
jgi:hypothetical protein